MRPFNRTFVVAIVVLIATWIFTHGRSTPYNNYVLFADALLHGHLWINWPGSYIDAVLWNSHRYIVNDPLPGVLLMPFVAIFGTAANQTLLAVVLCAIAVAAAWVLCRRLNCSPETSAWLCLFFWAGTPLLWCSMLGDVWFIAQTSCVCFLTLALAELYGKNRSWLVLLLYVAAIASRFTVVMALPVIVALSLMRASENRKSSPRDVLRSHLISAAAVLVPAAALWIAYNLARWGVPWDSGHTIFYHQDSLGTPGGSPFALANVPNQLYSFFVQYPAFSSQAPFVIPSFSGVALTWTSPALALVLFARRPRADVIAMWLATALAIGPSLLYYVNGYAQYGMRHILDVLPFLLVLMALAAREKFSTVMRVFIVYSFMACMYGVWYWNAIVRPST